MKFFRFFIVFSTLFPTFFSSCSNTNSSNNDKCGDDFVDLGEECDGSNLGVANCQSLGYYGGNLTCASDCKFDVTSCIAIGICGDSKVQADYGETCDGTNLAGNSCETLGYSGGTLACNSDCTLNIDSCEGAGLCGNGTIDVGETCDGTNMSSLTCELFGYYPGTLTCSVDCGSLDFSSCGGYCGDGILQSDYETCEGTNLNGVTCESLGYYGGTLTCNSSCSFDISYCQTYGWCGDGILQTDYEECDGTNFGEISCETYGFYEGNLTCTSDCANIDTSACYGFCGDNDINGTETCDGSNLGETSCIAYGSIGGTISTCNLDCTPDLTVCDDYEWLNT